MARGKGDEELGSIQLTIVIYILAMALKLIGFFATGIMVLLADALHTLSDIVVFGLMLAASYWARKEADTEHMFGHERAQNAAALVAATLFIFLTSFGLLREAVPQLFAAPEQVSHPGIALVIIGAAMILQVVPIVRLMLQKERSAASKATLWEGVNDQLSTIAALIGTLFIMGGAPVVDPVATIVVALLIAYNGGRLFQENFSFLIGKSPGREFLDRIRGVALSVPEVKEVSSLRAEYVGPRKVHVGMRIGLSPDLTLKEAQPVLERVRSEVHNAIDLQGSYCFIQMEPAEEHD